MSAEPVETPTCIRKWFSVSTLCGCPPCALIRNRYRKLHANGAIPAPPVDQAWDVIDVMLARDWSNAAIASACGLPARTIESAIAERRGGHRRAFGRVICQRIIGHGEPTAGHVGSLGTVRRLRALQVAGWTGDAIVEGSGGRLSRMAVSFLLRGDQAMVSPRVAAVVAETYRVMSGLRDGSRGPSLKVTEAATAKRWAGPACWDDIDDPDERPKGLGWAPNPDGTPKRRKSVGSV